MIIVIVFVWNNLTNRLQDHHRIVQLVALMIPVPCVHQKRSVDVPGQHRVQDMFRYNHHRIRVHDICPHHPHYTVEKSMVETVQGFLHHQQQ